MGGKKQNKALKRLLSLALTLALVFTLTPLAGGLVTETAYADSGSEAVTVELEKVSCDTMNDIVVLMVKVTKNSATDGISGLDFRVNFPDKFELAEIENMNYFGEGEGKYSDATDGDVTYNYTSSIQGQDKTKTNFYLGYYSMNKEADVSKKTGAVAKLTFKVENGKTLEAGTQTFRLSSIKAYTVKIEKETNLPTSSTPSTNSTSEYSYVSIGSSTATTSTSTVTVGADTTGKAVLKTDALAGAVSSENKTVTLDLSNVKTTGTKSDTSASDATVTATTLEMSKTSAGEIAAKNNDATMALKTSGASLEFDNTTLDSIADRTGGEKLVIEVKQEDKIKTGDNTSATGVIYDVAAKLVSAEPNATETEVTDITQFGGGEVTVTLDVPEAYRNKTFAKTLKCYYINESSSPITYSEVKDGKVSADKTKYSFTTTHFSKYALATAEYLDKYVSAINAKPACTISGTVVSYGKAGTVTVTLKQGDTVKGSAIVSESGKDGTFTNTFVLTPTEELAKGKYTLEISKAGHATLTQEIEITDDDKTSSMTAKAASIYLYGDVDLNGVVTAADAQQVQRYAAKLTNNIDTAYKIKLADANGNKKLTAADAQEIQRKAAGLTSTIDNLK